MDNKSKIDKSKSLSEKGSIEKHLFKNKKCKFIKKNCNNINFVDYVNIQQNNEYEKPLYNSKSNLNIFCNNINSDNNNYLKELFQKIDDIKKNQISFQDQKKIIPNKINQNKEDLKDIKNKIINDNDNDNDNDSVCSEGDYLINLENIDEKK